MIKIRNILKYYFFLIFFISSLNAQNSFIQNKGQFPKKVKAKVNFEINLMLNYNNLIDLTKTFTTNLSREYSSTNK